MIFRKSVTAKFIVMVFIILLAGQVLGTGLIFLNMKNALFDSLEDRIDRLARVTAPFVAEAVSSYEYPLIAAYVEKMAGEREIVSASVRDLDGVVIREVVKTSLSENQATNSILFSGTIERREPLLHEGAKVGEITIVYSAVFLNGDLIDRIGVVALFQVLIIVVTGLILFVLFNLYVKKPVMKIHESIERITLGDLATPVPDLGEDEIGSIAQGVGFLSEKLSATVSKLTSTATNVSMAIKQVDVMYRNVLEGTTKQSTAVKEIMQSLVNANKSQEEIISSTEKLLSVSAENVSSLLEMKATAEEIAVNTDRLFNATEDSYSVVLEMTRSSKSVSNHSREVVSAIEDTSASVEEVWASIKEVEEHARESSRLAESVKEITSDRGMLEVVNAVEGMDRISDEVMKSAEIIQRLGTRSADIEKVLSVIKDVTEQTNLLSLNAAILAAQAGEYGKSFSVVADEIRALSERTASSTREISGIVKTIQKDIKDAVGSIDTARKKVEEGNSLVLLVGDALKEILTASEHSTDMTKAIQKATEEQAIGLRQITSAVEDIRKMMNSVANSTSEQDKALSHLLEGVGEVKEVADFSKRGTEEEAVGTKTISKNLELANERIAQIGKSGTRQKGLNDEIMAAMDQIGRLGVATVRDMEDVANSLKTLNEEIDTLKKEMEVFKLSK